MDAPLYIGIKFCEMPCEIEEDSKNYDGWLSSSWFQEERIHKDVLPCTLQMERRYSFRYVRIDVLDTSPKWKGVFARPSADAISCAKDADIPEIEDKEFSDLTNSDNVFYDIIESAIKVKDPLSDGEYLTTVICTDKNYHSDLNHF